MKTSAKLVGFTSLNLDALLPYAEIALDRNIAEVPDAANCDPPLHHMLCVAAVKNPSLKANASSTIEYLNMFSAAMLVVCEEYFTGEILECAAMPSVLTQSKKRGIDFIILSGTLSQWRDAMLRGASPVTVPEVRSVYNQIYNQFSGIRLEPVFEFKTKPCSDSTFLLEHK
jgi:hypothetical protein